MKTLKLKNKEFQLPMFLPDATRGFVKGVYIKDVENTGINGLVVNIYHLLKEELIGKISRGGRIHKYMNFPGLIISDSGGFQVMSLIRDNKENGEILDDGVVFKMDNNSLKLTPENCVRLQFLISSDIIMCLDDCTRPELGFKEQEKSVERTIAWAKRCKNEFLELTSSMSENERPLLFGIIQGGNNKELRRKCAEELIKIGFDGYAFGGFPVDDNGKFLTGILKFVCELMPDDKAKYAMGVGKPEDIVSCVEMGYDLFDCVIPTREARNNRLYSYKSKLFGFGLKKLSGNNSFYKYVRVRNLENKSDNKPISDKCDCYTCKNFTKAQIYELFKNKDKESIRLTTIHNLRFYSQLMERLRG